MVIYFVPAHIQAEPLQKHKSTIGALEDIALCRGRDYRGVPRIPRLPHMPSMPCMPGLLGTPGLLGSQVRYTA